MNIAYIELTDAKADAIPMLGAITLAKIPKQEPLIPDRTQTRMHLKKFSTWLFILSR